LPPSMRGGVATKRQGEFQIGKGYGLISEME
jgi:hypothetical protein